MIHKIECPSSTREELTVSWEGGLLTTGDYFANIAVFSDGENGLFHHGILDAMMFHVVSAESPLSLGLVDLNTPFQIIDN